MLYTYYILTNFQKFLRDRSCVTFIKYNRSKYSLDYSLLQYKPQMYYSKLLKLILLSNLRNMGLDVINNVVSYQFTSGEEFLVIL